jgi:hypothetical protein
MMLVMAATMQTALLAWSIITPPCPHRYDLASVAVDLM